MNITEIRRARLKAWFAKRTLPTDEKSYLSQLIGGKASFGEKAARRLEATYEMPPMYLDTPLEAAAPAPVAHVSSDLLDAWEWLTPEQQQDFLGQITKLAGSNKQIYEQFANAPTIGVRAREIKKAGRMPFAQRRKEDAK